MKYIESIKDGFRLINQNWQLVLMQAGVMFLSVALFFIIVGIPLAIAFIIFGIDLTGLTSIGDIFNMLRGPSDILSKYIGLLLFIMASIIIYFLVATVLGIYVFAGCIGIIGRSIQDKSLKFTIRTFMDEAKKLFLRLLGFTSVIGLIFIAAAFLLGLLGGGIAALVSFAQSQDSTLALFFGTFFSLVLVIFALIVTIGILSITLYGFAALYFKGVGAFRSIKEAVRFLLQYPNGFWLYTVLFIGYLLAVFLLGLLSYPFTLMPIIGTILSFPYQLISYVFQTYLGLVIIATILSYYFIKEIPRESEPPGAESPAVDVESETGETGSAGEAEPDIPIQGVEDRHDL
ncbi:MAG TPA: hypothetical protein VK435_05875 [Thermodesulfovibrionales bacterium]|nr:hypothetical protein [Thermodesulfovibrionales bacterium]